MSHTLMALPRSLLGKLLHLLTGGWVIDGLMFLPDVLLLPLLLDIQTTQEKTVQRQATPAATTEMAARPAGCKPPAATCSPDRLHKTTHLI